MALKAAMMQFDIDGDNGKGDGFISQQEMMAILMRTGSNTIPLSTALSRDEADRKWNSWLKAFDADGDGKISIDEITTALSHSDEVKGLYEICEKGAHEPEKLTKLLDSLANVGNGKFLQAILADKDFDKSLQNGRTPFGALLQDPFETGDESRLGDIQLNNGKGKGSKYPLIEVKEGVLEVLQVLLDKTPKVAGLFIDDRKEHVNHLSVIDRGGFPAATLMALAAGTLDLKIVEMVNAKGDKMKGEVRGHPQPLTVHLMGMQEIRKYVSHGGIALPKSHKLLVPTRELTDDAHQSTLMKIISGSDSWYADGDDDMYDWGVANIEAGAFHKQRGWAAHDILKIWNLLNDHPKDSCDAFGKKMTPSISKK